MPGRRKVPAGVKREVLLEGGYRCGNPICRTIITLEIHHLIRVADEGPDEVGNLIALCPNCHSLVTAGEIPGDAVRHWKRMQVALNAALDRRSLDLLEVIDQLEGDRHAQPVFGADGLVGLAPLLSTGLAEATLIQASSGAGWGPPSTTYRVTLTTRGRALLQSWREGNSDRYLEVLTDAGSDG